MGAQANGITANQLKGILLPWSGPQWSSESVSYAKQQEEAKRKAATSPFYAKYLEYERLYSAIASMSKLGEGWDGYGAPSPSLASVQLGTKYLGAFLREGLLPQRVVPSAEGGIALMFDSNPKRAYIEITNEKEISIGTYGKRQKLTITDLEVEKSVEVNAANVTAIVSNFFER